MRDLIPTWIPIPCPETMQCISIVSLIVGILFVIVGLILLHLDRKKGNKVNKMIWILIGIGAVLVICHGIQLLF